MKLKNLFWLTVGGLILKGMNDATAANTEGVGKIKIKSKFLPPYKNLAVPELGWQTETNFAWAQNKAGFYIIKENGKIVYIGAGRNVYKCAMRHFQPYETGQHNKQRYYDKYDKNDYTLRIILTSTPNQAFRFEAALIAKYQPRDNYIFSELDFTEKAKNTFSDYFKAPTTNEPAPF